MDNKIRRVAIVGMTENRGGIEAVIMNIYKNIDRTKTQFDFLLPYDMGTMAYEDEVLHMGGRIFRIIVPQKESFIKSRKCFIDYFKENPEVKAIHLNCNFPYALPLVMAKKAKVLIRIIHAHNSSMLFGFDKGIKGLIKKLRNIIVYRQIKTAPNVYLSCSDLAAESTFKSNKYDWIKNGIEIDKFQYDESVRKEIRTKYGINESEKLIGVVGKICAVKNPLYTLEIFNEYLKINPDSKLVYVGDGDLRDNVSTKIKEYGIEDKVIFTGMISDAHKWYQALDLFLLPSLFEGFPVVLVESQTAGLPSLVSDTITKQVKLTDLIEYKSNKLLATEWAIEIDKMFIDLKDRIKYKEEMIKERFDVKSMAEDVEKYYLS